MKKITTFTADASAKIIKKLKVAAYCRVSSGYTEQLASLETQKAHYEEYISSNPEWEYAGLYFDEGISGTKKEKRPALMRMVRDCEDGKIDLILTKSLSRFARNTTDCLELVRKLLDLGIYIYFEKENLNTGSMESELLLSVMSSLAQSESASMSENSRIGVRYRYENGSYKMSHAPYGYRVNDGEFSIDEEESKWVRFIFDEVLAGKSAHRIAAELNEKQVPTKKGGTWTGATVICMLRNEKYIGDCLYQKTFTDFQFKRHLNRGHKDQYYAKEHHEPIVSREVFETANTMIGRFKKAKNVEEGKSKYQNRYPFTGKLLCGECGSVFKRRINSTGALKYPAWVCKVHHAQKDMCSMKFIRESALESAFATMMNKLTFARNEVLIGFKNGLRSRPDGIVRRRINEIDATLADLLERRESLAVITTKGYLDSATFTKECNELQKEISSLNKERSQLQTEITGDGSKAESLAELLKFTEKGQMLSEFDGELFTRVVDNVTVCSKTELKFRLKCGLVLNEIMEN